MDKLLSSKMSRRDFLNIAAATATTLALTDLSGCTSIPRREFPGFDPEKNICLINCNIINVNNGRIIKERAVVVRNGMIISIRDNIDLQEKGIEIVDLNNQYLIPGLIDAHCHTTLPGIYGINILTHFIAILKQLKRNYIQQINSGVTTVRDTGAFPKSLHNYIDMIKKGSLVGPRIIYCNSFMNIYRGHPDIDPSDIGIFARPLECIMGSQSAWFTNPDDLLKKMNNNLENGASFVKLTMDDVSLMCGRGNIPVYTDEHLRDIFNFAEKHNIPVTGHIHYRFGFERGLKWGINNMDHTIGDAYISDQEIKEMGRKRISIVPTLVVGQMFAAEENYDEIPAQYRNDFIDNEQKIRREFIHSPQDRYCEPSLHGLIRDVLKMYKKYRCENIYKHGKYVAQTDIYYSLLKHAPTNIEKMREEGILIGCGTDAGVPFIYHGTLWRELELFSRVGFTNEEILKCATINNAKILRMDDKIGSIRKNRFADLVVLKNNPLKDVTVYRDPVMVMKGGKIMYAMDDIVKKITGSVYESLLILMDKPKPKIIELDFKDIDWIFIRQAFSLALFKKRAVKISNGLRFFEEYPEYKPLLNDIGSVVKELNLGGLNFDGESILFFPKPVSFGRYEIVSGLYSSIVEILLFLAPALFYKNFRTILNLRGVTHSTLSYPTSFIKETLFAMLERMGFFAHLSLKRFGFYGSGGGKAEARIYPEESMKKNIFSLQGKGSVTGARVYVSGLKTEIAKREKGIISERLLIADNRISIIEVMDSDGYGNSIQIDTDIDGMQVIFFREMEIYNHMGDFIFDEAGSMEILKGLIDEVKLFVDGSSLPLFMTREILPYLLFSESEINYSRVHSSVRLTESLCRKFIC